MFISGTIGTVAGNTKVWNCNKFEIKKKRNKREKRKKRLKNENKKKYNR